MEVYVLASGSKGNSTFVSYNNTNILIDIGITTINIEKRLRSIGKNPEDIDAILITHSHNDHINGLSVFVKKYHPKVYLLTQTFNELPMINEESCVFYKSPYLEIKSLKITLVKTSHDVASVGYIVSDDNEELVYITDTGYIRNKDYELLSNKTYYVFESNHDEVMLMNGPYPHYLKQRILSNKGHLSNKDSSFLLNKFIGDKTKSVILAHLSEENNTKEKAIETLKKEIEDKFLNLYIDVAKQNEVTLVRESINV